MLRTNTIKEGFKSNKRDFKFRLLEGGHPQKVVNKTQAEVEFTPRNNALKYKLKTSKTLIIPFLTTYNPGVPRLKEILMNNLALMTMKPSLARIFLMPRFYSLHKKDNITTILASCYMIVSLYSYLSNGYCHKGLTYNFVCKTSRFPNNNRLFFWHFC